MIPPRTRPRPPATRRDSSPSPLVEAAGVTRVLCVDDHAFLVEGLKAQLSVLGEGREFRVVGRLSTAQDLLKEAHRLRPDIILLDIEMPGPDPFEMADRLHRKDKRARMVFLSAYVRDHYIAQAYRCGACGYFSKADEIHDIIEGLRRIAIDGGADGEFVFGPKVKARCRPLKQRPILAWGGGVRTENREAQPSSRLETLSVRELEVLRLVGKGLSRSEVAKALSRSVKTIDRHQERMLKKLDLESRAELMRFAIREGLAEA